MSLKKHYLALDLKDDAALIATYKEHHQNVWPEIIESIKSSGVEDLEIYSVSNRLFMIMTVNETFTFERKAAMDSANPKVQEWEALMWKFQQALPFARKNEKWIVMESIFKMNEE